MKFVRCTSCNIPEVCYALCTLNTPGFYGVVIAYSRLVFVLTGTPRDPDGCIYDKVYTSMSSNIKLRDLPELFILSKFSRRNGRSSL